MGSTCEEQDIKHVGQPPNDKIHIIRWALATNAMSTITLSCLVAGENSYENAFQVVIDTTQIKTVGRYQGKN
ncbi:unnamed protein product [Rhizophagus irregularis]|nr:unnamed protein product [Rhizophagus irregularis]